MPQAIFKIARSDRLVIGLPAVDGDTLAILKIACGIDRDEP
ncbi:hypothetical protein X765_32160 [Mesorhizobium sp. LSHC440B00]|nr:hypothetical protein X765_32160 [Mesorhizobium sp. LSHC440B00]